MEYIGRLFTAIIGFLQRDLVLYGYTFTLWGVIVFLAVASIVGAFLWALIFE